MLRSWLTLSSVRSRLLAAVPLLLLLLLLLALAEITGTGRQLIE
jgi:hypothetical protein